MLIYSQNEKGLYDVSGVYIKTIKKYENENYIGNTSTIIEGIICNEGLRYNIVLGEYFDIITSDNYVEYKKGNEELCMKVIELLYRFINKNGTNKVFRMPYNDAFNIDYALKECKK